MKTYQTPQDLAALLDGVVRAASMTDFYSRVLPEGVTVGSMEDFAGIPVTPLERYRGQDLSAVVAEPGRVEWIVGPYRGQSADSVAIAEGPDEGESRYDLFTDAVKECVSLEGVRTCAVVASPRRRQFGAEVATILIYAGVQSHLFIDYGDGRTYERLHHVTPDLLVLASDPLDEDSLPASTKLCVTFRRSQRMRRLPQLDMYVVDELGFLGQSTDCRLYTLNRDVYYFERAAAGNLVVTSLYNKVQPLLKLETADRVKLIGQDKVELVRLAA